jgi:hypothetical protein
MKRSAIAVCGAILAMAGAMASSVEAQQSYNCTVNDTTLCLGEGGRFEVEVNYAAGGGLAGGGHAVPLFHADKSPILGGGYFWFFDADTPELFVKVIDACVAPFNAYWVFTAGLTNVAYTLLVTDLKTGKGRVYENALGQTSLPVYDTVGFDSCP